MPAPVLHLFCGKIGSGKSTLAAQLAGDPSTILIAQDPWLAGLYPGEIGTLEDYVRCSSRLRLVLEPHIVALLRLGLSVALDFPANTRSSRNWMRDLFEGANAGHRLYYLDVPDAVCLERLHYRNASGEHDYVVSDEEFFEFGAYFEPPSSEEGFDIDHRPVS